MIAGVDVHAGYDILRPIDWDVAAGVGVEFAIVKCTLGNEPNGDDRSFRRNVAGAKAAGLKVGMYHFGFPLLSGPNRPPGRSPREQAERAFSVSGGLGGSPGELQPALDLEWPPHYQHTDPKDPSTPLIDMWSKWSICAQFIAEWTLEWMEHAERLWGRVPMLYTYPDFWRSLGVHGQAPAFARYPLWIATYAERDRKLWLPPDEASPIVPAPWTEWAIWQFSADGSTARVPGISACPIDRDCMRDTAALARLAGLPPSSEPERPLDFALVHPLPDTVDR